MGVRETGLVSFIVPAFNAERTLGKTVATIREAAAGFRHEIVIIDDGSLDGTRALAEELGDVVASRPCQAGAARGRNDAVRRAAGDVFFFVDSDVTVNPEAVSIILDHLDAGADAAFGAYTPLPPEEVRNAPTVFKNLLHHFTHLHGGGDVTTFWSGFSAITREAFFAIQGFDPRVTWSADVEDIHLGYRLTKHGGRIVLDPRAQVMHHKRYKVRGMVMSDLVHRAIPWTKAMLELRTFNVCLNLKGGSVASSLVLYGAGGALVALPFAPLAATVALAGTALTWGFLNRAILLYARGHWRPFGAARVAFFLGMMNLYAPAGAAVGVVLHLLRGPHRSVRNTLGLPDFKDEANAEVEVTVAVVLDGREGAETVASLPDPEPWWELVVVGRRRPAWLHAHARFVAAGEKSRPTAQSQAALDHARGKMIALLSSRDVAEPGWLDHVRVAATRGDLAVGGSFEHDRRGRLERAQGVLWHWKWRPEFPAMWMQDHPPTNAAYRVGAVRRVGGFDGEPVALYRRLSAYGARPVRFEPAMKVRQATDASPHPVRGMTRFARAASASMVRYYDYSLGVRLAFVAVAPIHVSMHLVRLVGQAIQERTADRTFWAALPKITAGMLMREAGTVVGMFLAQRSSVELRLGDPGVAEPETVARLA